MARKRRKPRPRRPPVQTAAAPAPKPAAAAAKPRARAQIDDQRPPAPWGSFPLVELVVLVGLVMIAIGFFTEGNRGTVLLVTGIALGSLAGLELSVREHFAGYRSHTTLLAAVLGVAVMLGLYYFGDLPAPAAIAVGAAAALGAAWLLVREFRARAGRSIKLR